MQGAGFRVQGSGFRVQGSGFRVLASEFRVQGFRVLGSVCSVKCAGSRVMLALVTGLGVRVQGSGCRVQGAGCRVQGSRCRVYPDARARRVACWDRSADEQGRGHVGREGGSAVGRGEEVRVRRGVRHLLDGLGLRVESKGFRYVCICTTYMYIIYLCIYNTHMYI